MPRLVFIHGPGAGACADAWTHQLKHFPGSLAPTLPGSLGGSHCPDVPRYTEWVRGWLWAQGLNSDLILVGYTLGSSIALQYGLDYPEEVRGLVLSTVAAGRTQSHSGRVDMRLAAARGDPGAYEKWVEFQKNRMMWVAPELREKLVERHRQVGPMSQYKMLAAHHDFDVMDRLHSLKPKLLLIRGVDDPVNPPDTEKEVHDKVEGSKLVYLSNAGHFPATERPDEVNRLIEELIASL
jgi:pimeloyl-ACP methyl ester carboxylesterase